MAKSEPMTLGLVGRGALGAVLADALAARVELRVLERGANPSLLAGCDLLLVAVKTYHTVDALRPLRAVLGSGTPVVSFQNGADQVAQISAALGERRPIGLAPTTEAASVVDGAVRRIGRGLTTLGWARGHEGGTLEPLRALLGQGGLETRLAQPIEPHVWAKLVANAAINPLTALAGVPNGAIGEDAMLHVRAAKLAREVAAVAAAEGIVLPFDDPVAHLDAVLRATAGNRSSMLVDLERGGPTEIDAINGAVVRQGRLYAIATPENARVYDEVQARVKA